MKGWNLARFLSCSVVVLLTAVCPTVMAQMFSEDPNLVCSPGKLWYRIVFDASGDFVEGEGWGYQNTWSYSPVTDMYRQWYYRGPYSTDTSVMTVYVGLEPLDTARTAWAHAHFLWSTPAWSALGYDHPPLPADLPSATEDALYVASSHMLDVTPSFFSSVEPYKTCLMSDCSPEWVGIEVTGGNMKMMRWVAPASIDNDPLDFGDAPDTYGTSLASNGARHLVVELEHGLMEAGTTVCLGSGVDTETDARPGSGATGDDDYGDQDEDGVVFNDVLAAGSDTSITVTASTAGYLNAWFDFDHDGTFSGSNERVFANQLLAAGANQLTLSIPATALTGATYARFRFCLDASAGSYKGLVSSGEVEDYVVHLVSMRDTFSDNTMGSQWCLEQEDASHVWLEEVNRRLELRSTASAAGERAQYASNYWKLNPAEDFSMKVNYHFTPVTAQQAWLSVRLTPNVSGGDANHVDFNVGCGGSAAQFRDEIVNSDSVVDQDSTGRSQEDGCLYISYDAALDELYLSSTGSGRDNAWKTISGLLAGQWGGASLVFSIGGTVNGLQIDEGQVWLDDFIVDAGTLSGPAAVYRFYAASTSGEHFYTIREGEKNKLINTLSHIWTYEGVAFHAFSTAQPDTLPIYRFWSAKAGEHFYTIKEGEKNKLINNSPDVWTYENVAFYAYPPTEAQPTGTVPIYRFYAPSTNMHFFTRKEGEKNKLMTTQSSVWQYEGVAWYAYE